MTMAAGSVYQPQWMQQPFVEILQMETHVNMGLQSSMNRFFHTVEIELSRQVASKNLVKEHKSAIIVKVYRAKQSAISVIFF